MVSINIQTLPVKIRRKKTPKYHYIIGSRIDATSYQDAWNRIEKWVRKESGAYVIAANVHVVMMGYWHKSYQKIINGAALVTPDGMPLVWGLKLLGIKKQKRVYGPDLMLTVCDRAAAEQIPIYLYGGSETTLSKLSKQLKEQYPNLIIAGTHSPPFRELTPQEEEVDIKRIEASGAKIVFVGLGCPKQEQWMARNYQKISAVFLGVGAAFSFHSQEVKQAPRWMMSMGLEWLYRFSQEPKRLWQRYLVNNPAFVVLFGLQLLKKILFSHK